MISESSYFIQCDFVYGKKDAYGDYVNYIFIYLYDGEKTAMSFFLLLLLCLSLVLLSVWIS